LIERGRKWGEEEGGWLRNVLDDLVSLGSGKVLGLLLQELLGAGAVLR
jgi:hypothetical protein